jgi:hypothetical protein
MEPKACVTTQQIIDWFFENYEDPVERCPYTEGDYVFIFGGPYDAREEIEDNCTNAPDEAIEAAVTYLENGDHDAMEGGFGGCWRWSGVVTDGWYR